MFNICDNHSDEENNVLSKQYLISETVTATYTNYFISAKKRIPPAQLKFWHFRQLYWKNGIKLA